VFSSKATSPYTQLFLTHIDANGDSTPAVVLSRFTSPDRAANIPEFIKARPGAIARIQQEFLNDYSHARAAYTLEMSGEIDQAIASYLKALEVNPRNVHAHQRLGFLLFHARQKQQEGLQHTMEALKLDPQSAPAHYDLGLALKIQGHLDPALEHLREAIKLAPERIDNRYNPASFYAALGDALVAKGQAREGAEALQQSLKEDPRNARSHYILAMALAVQGLTEEALRSYTSARSISPAIDTAPELHFVMSVNYEKAGNFGQSLHWAQTALDLAEKSGDPAMVQAFRDRVRECQDRARNE
jgi:tetratricopeptide (TPR) repeat protein